MNNEKYLIISYFGVGLLSTVLGLATWMFLRRSFISIARTLKEKRFSRLLNSLFLPGLLLPALVGFLSVSFRGCGQSYSDIIADRSYLIAKNQEQLSGALWYIAAALIVWGFVVVGVLNIIKQHKKRNDL